LAAFPGDFVRFQGEFLGDAVVATGQVRMICRAITLSIPK